MDTNRLILRQSKRPEEHECYLRMAVQEWWSSRARERQFEATLFEWVMSQPPKVSAALTQMQPQAQQVFRDAYMVEYLSLPKRHSEADLHRDLLARLRDFLKKLGRDVCFIGSESPLQVGGRYFALDLLFFHHGLNCLVAIELKGALRAGVPGQAVALPGGAGRWTGT